MTEISLPIKHKPSEMELVLRKQMADEIGEEEQLTRDHRFMLLQKFGLMIPIINRGVKKPHWKEVDTWKRQLGEFYQITKGLVTEIRPNPRRFVKTAAPNSTPIQAKPWRGQWKQRPTVRHHNSPQRSSAS